MAGRPPKVKIDYSGWSVDMFDNDTKIDKLIDAQGWVGFGIYFYLCQRAYGSDGYFYKWCFADAATTARKMGGGIGAETVRETVRTCLQIGLFDDRLFDGCGILTSRGIQKRYVAVASGRRTYNQVIEQKYWLLTGEESAGLDFNTVNSNYEPSKLNYDRPKSNYEQQKRRKEKESKRNGMEGKENKQNPDAGADGVSAIFQTFEACGFRITSRSVDELNALSDEYSPEWVVEAIKRAADRGKKSLGYIKGILASWDTAGAIDDPGGKSKPAGKSNPFDELLREELRNGQNADNSPDEDNKRLLPDVLQGRGSE